MTHSSHYQTPGVADTLGIQETDMPPRETVDRRIGHTEDVAESSSSSPATPPHS